MKQPGWQVWQMPAFEASVALVMLLLQAFLAPPSYWLVTPLVGQCLATFCVQDELQWRTPADPFCHQH